MTEAEFARTWPLHAHLLRLVENREAAAEKGSYTAVSSLLKQEGELEARRAEDYRAYAAEWDRDNASRGSLVEQVVAKLRSFPDAVQDEIRAALDW